MSVTGPGVPVAGAGGPPNPIESGAVITRFGVELEFCVRTACIPELAGEKNLYGWDHQDLFELYAKNILHPNRHLLPFEYVIYMDDMAKGTSYNLTTGEAKELGGKYESLDFLDYKVPVFYEDMSVVCGDETPDVMARAGVRANDSFRLECVSPILSLEGMSSRSQMGRILQPYLDFVGLNRPDCFSVNYSSGFHVNVSIQDVATKKTYHFTPTFIGQFMRLYGPAEPDIYPRVRSRTPTNHDPRTPYISGYAYPFARNFNASLPNNALWRQYFPRMAKESAVHLKVDPESEEVLYKSKGIMEFRLFQAETDKVRLMEYANNAIRMFQQAFINTVALEPQSGGMNISASSTKMSAAPNKNEKKPMTREEFKDYQEYFEDLFGEEFWMGKKQTYEQYLTELEKEETLKAQQKADWEAFNAKSHNALKALMPNNKNRAANASKKRSRRLLGGHRKQKSRRLSRRRRH